MVSTEKFGLFNLVNVSDVFSGILGGQINGVNRKGVYIELSLLMNGCLL